MCGNALLMTLVFSVDLDDAGAPDPDADEAASDIVNGSRKATRGLNGSRLKLFDHAGWLSSLRFQALPCRCRT